MYAIFTTSRPRVLHAAHEGASATVCGLPIGRGSGLVRDGNYNGATDCPRGCWRPMNSDEQRADRWARLAARDGLRADR